MRIVVLGATGGTGRLVIEQAVARGHEIVAYVRRPEVLATSTGLTVVQGELSNIKALQAAVKHPPAEPGALECEPLKAAGGVADAAPNCIWPPFGGPPHQGNICSNR
jgi:NAD(P)-dependent dehydrogenase (short-subunit alcohol dehydrogenase family)